MKPIEIGEAYDKIAHLWEHASFNRMNGVEQHRRAFKFAKNRGKALDIGCGCSGRFIDLMIEEGFEPTGLDVSTKMLDLARRRHPNVEFIHSDICIHQPLEKYDFITAWDSIWHIPLDEQRAVITKIIGSLSIGGVFIFSFGGTDQPGAHTDDFMGPEVYYSSLGTQGFLGLMLELGCTIRHLEFDQYPELHTYMIVEKN